MIIRRSALTMFIQSFSLALLLTGIVLSSYAFQPTNPASQMPAGENKEAHEKLNSMTETSKNKNTAFSGHWAVVDKIQDVLDAVSPDPKYQGGRLDNFHVQLIETSEFWNYRQLKPIEQKITQLAAKRKHEIVATGQLACSVADKPLAGFTGFFILTQNSGQTFLSVINVDGVTFTPWRTHFIRGKSRERDLLIVEVGSDLGKRQIAAFQRATEIQKP